MQFASDAYMQFIDAICMVLNTIVNATAVHVFHTMHACMLEVCILFHACEKFIVMHVAMTL